MESFGKRLRAAREARGITQETLGFEVGVTSATISKWETGRSEPTLDQLNLLAEFLGRDINYFVRSGSGADSNEARSVPDPRRALNADEETFLIRFRALSPAKRQGILVLMSPEG